jgi:hypothetical protein
MVLRSTLILAFALSAASAHSWAEAGAIQDAQGHRVSIDAVPFRPRAGTDDVPFTRFDGSLFGLHQENYFSPRDFYPPFFNGGARSS